MRSVATDGLAWSVCVSVSLSVVHIRKPCKNGRTDRVQIWSTDSHGPKKLCIRWGRDPPREGAILGSSDPLKALGVSAAVYAAKGIIHIKSAIAARRAMRSFVKILLPPGIIFVYFCRTLVTTRHIRNVELFPRTRSMSSIASSAEWQFCFA